jgi:hypothetical protein
MEPLFDENCELIGWIDPRSHIFDIDLNWVAYISRGHAWSTESGNWLGPVPGLICLDQYGCVVAWNPKEQVAGSPRPPRPPWAPRAPKPPRPPRPPQPPRPPRPPQPVGGWSDLSFRAWLSQ